MLTSSYLPEIIMYSANILRDRHLIIIQDDHQLLLLMADMIQRFERHTARHRSIADDRSDPVVLTLIISSERHPHGCRQRSAAMTGLPYIMLTLGAFHVST